MISYHGKESIKKKYLKRVAAHEAADEIIKGKYWEKGKGCAVGCTIHGSDHSKYENELGIPTWLARLEDRLFEGVSDEYAKTFPKKFLASIPVGVDLDKIKGPFLCFVMRSTLTKFDHKKYPEIKKSIERIIKAWETNATIEEFREASADAAYATYAAVADVADVAAAAADAAANVAYAAAYAADAAYATYAAAYAAYAAYAYAAGAYAAAAVKQNEYEKFADELLRLMGEMK